MSRRKLDLNAYGISLTVTISPKEQGLVLGTGINTDGQLGTGDDVDRHTLSPVSLPAEVLRSGVTAIDAGADTSSIVTSEGTLYTFGNSVSCHLIDI